MRKTKKLKPYRAVIRQANGDKYQTFWCAEDTAHAREQAKDYIRGFRGESIVSVRPTRSKLALGACPERARK